MLNVARGLILIAFLAFVAAVIGTVFGGSLLGGLGPPEAFSRASTNLALVGIGVALCFKD